MAERFEPIIAALLDFDDFFLQRSFGGNKLGFFCAVGFPLDVLFKVSVQKPLDFDFQIFQFRPRFFNEAGRRLGQLPLVSVCHCKQPLCPVFGQSEFFNFLRQLAVEFFFPDKRFGAFDGFSFSGAAVIDIFVGVAVFLVFGFSFGGDRHSASAAPDQAAKRPGVVLGLAMDMRPLLQYFLHFVEKLLRDNLLVFAFVKFAGIAEQSAIERIGKDKRYPRKVERFLAFGGYAVFGEKGGNVFKALVALGIHLKSLPHYL
ncbi:MAG: hypothetical protein L7H18_05325 [Candidatus Nealsonbacteria bacterium DGGOD1a]|nr:MAG: hypothetical protein L7H18_05325 [Candidatus Nealsonbacteria bacterium DGGOD1a]